MLVFVELIIVQICLFYLLLFTVQMCFQRNLRGTDSLGHPVEELNYVIEDFDSCDYVEHVNIVSKDVTVVQLNVRGIASKQDKIKQMIEHCVKGSKVDVILLCETWLSPFSPSISLPGYDFYHIDRSNKRGGGIGILVSNQLKHKHRPDLEVVNPVLENITIEILLRNNQKLLCTSMYRPPSTNVTDFIETFSNIVGKIVKTKNQSIVLGLDHNLDFLKHETHGPTRLFIERILDLGLYPTVSRPTRITKSSATLIDNILVSQNLIEKFTCNVILDDISDHLPTALSLTDMNLAKTEPLTVTSRDTRERNMKALIRELSKADCANIIDPNDVNLSTNRIHELLVAKIDHHLPLVTRQVNYKNVRREPWLSAGLLRCIKRSKKLYSRSIRHNSTESDCLVYKDYCRTLAKTKRLAKKQYYEVKCVEYKHNTKKLWNVINKVCSKSNDKTSVIEYLKIDNIHEYKANKISNHLGKYFSSVGKNYANKIPRSSQPVHSYISRIPRNPVSIMLSPVCEQEIERILTKLPAKCSSGHDNISNLLLKRLKTIVVPLLCKLSNTSLSTGVFPDVMKLAEVVPLHKGKSPHDECNYRPISLLTTMSKILEKVVYSRVYGFLDSTGQIYDSQYGFRANHSCEHAVSEVVSEILKSNEQNKHTIGIFLDLSKAFDTLDHKLVLEKMEKYGIRALLLNGSRVTWKIAQ